MLRISSILATFALVSFSLAACAQDRGSEPEQATPVADSSPRQAQAAPMAAAPVQNTFVAGQHYHVIEPAQPTSSGNRIEVIEVFSYGCVHCATFQPYVDAWLQRKPEHASFVHMPAIFNQDWDVLARIFYTAEVLDILDRTHTPTFERIHRNRQPLRSVEQAADFYASLGVVERDAFVRAAESFAVNTKHSRSRSLVPRYGIEGTPSLIVAGKYRVSGASAGGFEGMWEVVDYLIAKEVAAQAEQES